MQSQETTSQLKPTRASFIRDLPLSMPIDEVIERGREAGLELQPSDIHAQRYYMRQASAPAPEAPTPKSTPTATQLVLGVTGASMNGVSKRDSGRDSGRDDARSVKGSSVHVMTALNADARGAENDRSLLAALGTLSKTAAAAAKARARLPAPLATGTSADEQLRTLILRLGTERTRTIMAELEDMITHLL
jgi:hypothetical protein